jgi:quercetin dioxygenase-like cupin family protein
MALEIQPIRSKDWTPLPFEGCINVSVKMLIKQPHLRLAMLRFEPNATIHEHPADIDIDVICLEGEGMVSLGNEQSPLKAGEQIRWTAGVPHRLWTISSTMTTLMVEHHSGEIAK